MYVYGFVCPNASVNFIAHRENKDHTYSNLAMLISSRGLESRGRSDLGQLLCDTCTGFFEQPSVRFIPGGRSQQQQSQASILSIKPKMMILLGGTGLGRHNCNTVLISSSSMDATPSNNTTFTYFNFNKNHHGNSNRINVNIRSET